MDKLIAELVDKCGLSEDKAKQVASFIVDNIDEIPGWIGTARSLGKKLPGGLGDMF